MGMPAPMAAAIGFLLAGNAAEILWPGIVALALAALLGAPVTPEVVARVLAHPLGGCKNVPDGARVVALINKVETLSDLDLARETAASLLRASAIKAVVLAAVRRERPVLEVCSR